MAEYSAITAVALRIGNLVAHESSLVCAVTTEVELLKGGVARLQGFLKDADEKMRNSGGASIAVCVRQIRDATYEAENIIEAAEYVKRRSMLKKGFMGAILRYANLPSDLVALHNIHGQIRHIARKINEIKDDMVRLNVFNSGTGHLEMGHVEHAMLMAHSSKNDAVVGFENDYIRIREKLVNQDNNLRAVSLVAMGGAGKTTLARKLYNSHIIRNHFDTVAWVTVSQKFQSIDLLKEIMKQITGSQYESRGIDHMNEDHVMDNIRAFLWHKRYLIVLDDVWENNTWKKINGTFVFPDVNNFSRIMLTTRKYDVAYQIEESMTYVHHLKPLDEETSWELFRNKALPSDLKSKLCNPNDIENSGRKMANKCGGLPLALAILGGYVSRRLHTKPWPDVFSGWTSIITDADTLLGTMEEKNMMGVILARSYDDLPDHYMKCCFLYIASFPEDYIISVMDLVELWIAECFIPHKEGQTLEKIALMYVEELAQRSLVQIVDRSKAHGWITKIRVHDILREWCIEEARKDSFLDIIDQTSGEVRASSSDTKTFYRSSFQNFCYDDIFRVTPNLRTLVGFAVPSFPLSKLRFLRVLHIERSTLKNFSSVISWCIHLRCLRLRLCHNVTLPSSVGKLLYLQTIDLRAVYLLSPVPSSLWAIPGLRHVYLKTYISMPRASSARPKDMQTLWLSPHRIHSKRFRRDMVSFFGQMTQLRSFFLHYRHIPEEMIEIFAKMTNLVEIYVGEFTVLNKFPKSNQFPHNLRLLRLRADVMKEDPMPILEKLGSLVLLELKGYIGRRMHCSSQGFPKLQQLELCAFSTEEWIVEVNAMKILSILTLKSFRNMIKLPEGLRDLPLEELDLWDITLISQDDDTLKELQKKRCKVTTFPWSHDRCVRTDAVGDWKMPDPTFYGPHY